MKFYFVIADIDTGSIYMVDPSDENSVIVIYETEWVPCMLSASEVLSLVVQQELVIIDMIKE